MDNVSWDRPHEAWYLSDSLLGISDVSEARLRGVTARRRPDEDPENRFLVWDPSASEWTTASIKINRQEPGPDMPYARVANKNGQDIESKVLVSQHKILKDLVTVTMSYREDESRSFSTGNSAPRGPRFERLYKDPSFVLPEEPDLEASGSIFSYGAVVRIPGFITDKIPNVDRLSVFYNESENFEPGTLLQDPFGNPLGAPTGTTQDIGFRLSLLENKVNLNVTWYETDQSGVNAGLGGVATAVARLESRVLTRLRENDNSLDVSQLNPSTTTPGLTQAQLDAQIQQFLNNPWPRADRWLIDLGDRVDFSTPAGTTDTFDLTSEGVEFEAVLNITPNWRMMVNAAKQEAMQSNTGTRVLEFVNERIDLYRAVPDLPATESFAQNVRTSLNNDILAQYFQVANRDGNLLPEVREWRFNLITNYKFTEGVMNGINVGGAYRWQDEVSTGYETFFDDELGIFRIDVDSPFFGPSTDNLDLWVGYETELADGKVAWKTQLNVRNALDDDDLVPFYTNPDGTDAGFLIPNERTYELRTTFSF